jgi:hypothetical protein
VTLAIAALAVAAVFGMTSTAVGATAAKTKITIQTEADGFSGFVSSPADKCQNNRKVTLYRVTSS